MYKTELSTLIFSSQHRKWADDKTNFALNLFSPSAQHSVREHHSRTPSRRPQQSSWQGLPPTAAQSPAPAARPGANFRDRFGSGWRILARKPRLQVLRFYADVTQPHADVSQAGCCCLVRCPFRGNRYGEPDVLTPPPNVRSPTPSHTDIAPAVAFSTVSCCQCPLSVWIAISVGPSGAGLTRLRRK